MLYVSYVLFIFNLVAPTFQANFEMLYWLLILFISFIYSDFLIKECFRRFGRFIFTGAKSALIPNEKFTIFELTLLSVFLSVLSYLTNSGSKNTVAFILTFLILVFYRYIYSPSKFEIEDLTARHNLSIGYGQALCYYENYLKNNLGNKLIIRIRNFESREGIRIPHKLYILVPHSCILIDYIDDSENISRCKEVTPLEIDYSGIPSRTYNITVYSIRNSESHERCALEYAQPLKALNALKDRNRLNEEELQVQRRIFCDSLNKMLRDGRNSYKYCELIEFDDERDELHEVLLSHIKRTEFVQKN